MIKNLYSELCYYKEKLFEYSQDLKITNNKSQISNKFQIAISKTQSNKIGSLEH